MAYPFERLNNLLALLTPNSNASPISLSIGEPKHQPPGFALEILSDQKKMRALFSPKKETFGGDRGRKNLSTG